MIWLSIPLAIRVDGRVPAHWAPFYSAHSLFKGDWLGASRSLALVGPPGYSFWIAFNHWIGLPLPLGSLALLALAGAAFVTALRKAGIPKVILAFLFAFLLLDPTARELIERGSVTFLKWPLILLSSSAYFLSTQYQGRWKTLLRVVAGIFLAFYWITFSSPWLPLAMVSWMLLWESRRSWQIAPLLLALVLPTAIADLSIRAGNQSHYSQFSLQQHRAGQSFTFRAADAPASDALVDEMSETSVGRSLKEGPESGEWREPLRRWIAAWHARLGSILGIAAVLGAILVVAAKLQGQGSMPTEFWIFAFSILLGFFLEIAVAGGLREFRMFGRRAWPLATLVACEAAILLEQARHFRFAAPRWKVERLFLVFAVVFGLFFALANPPFQAADEGAHAFRALQTSQGEGPGAPVPLSIAKVIGPFWHLSFHSENRTSLNEVLAAFKIPIDETQRGDLGSFSVSVLSHLPQATGFFLGRRVGLPTLALLYLGRIFNLAVWIGLVYFAIRRLPFFKWVFFLLALSPMCLYQAASLSHDALSNGATFLLIATLLQFSFGSEDRLSFRRLLGLVAIASLAAISKAVYFPLVLLYFWIPLSKLGSRRRYFAAFALVFGVSLALNLALNMGGGPSKDLYVAVTSGVAGAPAVVSPWDKASFFLAIAWDTLKANYPFYLESYIGRLGWLDTALPTALLFFYGIAALLLARLDGDSSIRFGFPRKALTLAVFALIVLMILYGFWMAWTKPGAALIDGVQGRYFIPLGPLFFILLYKDRAGHAKPGDLAWWVPVTSGVVLAVAAIALLARYYYLA